MAIPEVHCAHLAENSHPCQSHTLPEYYDDLYFLGLPEDPLYDPSSCAAEWRACDQLNLQLANNTTCSV